MIGLMWREIRQVFVREAIIKGIQDNIENYIEELIKYASPYEHSIGDIDAEDITDLVTKDEFLEKFKKWYEDE